MVQKNNADIFKTSKELQRTNKLTKTWIYTYIYIINKYPIYKKVFDLGVQCSNRTRPHCSSEFAPETRKGKIELINRSLIEWNIKAMAFPASKDGKAKRRSTSGYTMINKDCLRTNELKGGSVDQSGETFFISFSLKEYDFQKTTAYHMRYSNSCDYNEKEFNGTNREVTEYWIMGKVKAGKTISGKFDFPCKNDCFHSKVRIKSISHQTKTKRKKKEARICYNRIERESVVKIQRSRKKPIKSFLEYKLTVKVPSDEACVRIFSKRPSNSEKLKQKTIKTMARYQMKN